jgi:FkbM family methyltransferase
MQKKFKSLIISFLKRYPRIYWRLKLWNQVNIFNHEKELLFLPALASKDLISIDIGASSGIYSIALLAYSKKIYSFEPRADGIRDLSDMTRALRLPIQVETVALSNKEGEAELRMLKYDLGRSTIAPENALFDPDESPERRVLVIKRKLDSYGLSGIGFIKIDVEGHEKAVLEGAEQTIEKNRCNLLIEMEERHCPGVICEVKAWLEHRHYEGFFIDEGEILAMEMFRPSIHQDPKNIGGWKENWSRKGKYINNFIFVPEENKSEFLRKAKALKISFRGAVKI